MAAIYSSTPGDWVVDAHGLTKQFGDQFAVQNLTFQIPKGKIIGFIGPSGCGKTTTVRLLTGIYTPTRGEVTVMGVRPRNFNADLRERMGYMPQLFVLYPDLSVWENMNFAASLYGMSLFSRGKRLKALLDFVELKDDRFKLARNISGGMQRRLALAATLVHDPELIFLDEPTAGIDPILRRKFWDHFEELKQTGRTLFITTQYVNEASYCDYVGVMAEGKLLMLETPEGLRRTAFGGDPIDVHTAQPLGWDMIDQLQKMPFMRKKIRVQPDNNTVRLIVEDASTAMPKLIAWLSEHNIKVSAIEEYLPQYDDVFVMIIEAYQERQRSSETATGLVGEETAHG